MLATCLLFGVLLYVSPKDALRDAPIQVQIHTQRFQRVDIGLRERDASGHEWRASVKARADARGNLRLAHPMQLFSSAVPSVDVGAPFIWPKNLQRVDGDGSHHPTSNRPARSNL